MDFWLFMLIENSLIPLIMIGFGSYFVTKAPKKINPIFGYRTSMSMKNRDTWEFAHHYCGKLWRICGFVLLAGTIIAMFLLLDKDSDVIGTYGGMLCVVQVVVLIFTIFPTEAALRKTFDKNGNRKN